jgi:hypothetical protein
LSRQSVPTRRLIETACAVLNDADAVEDCQTQAAAEDPITFAGSKSDPDTMHHGEAMKASDAKGFKQAMLREVAAHASKGHWEVWAKSDMPSDLDVSPAAVWAFRRKRRITPEKHASTKRASTLTEASRSMASTAGRLAPQW